MREVRRKRRFVTVALVLLWDHLHCIWTLPEGDQGYSARWKQIKAGFTDRWLAAGGVELPRTASRVAQGERGVWHRRFWEHIVRDEDDLERLVDYIHYNPVKHGYVPRPGDWPWSSFARFVRLGRYPPDWGTTEPPLPRHDHPE
jgi:putative transposase